MARFIFITGGVVSSLGKGLMAASLAALLQARGYRVRIRKFDPARPQRIGFEVVDLVTYFRATAARPQPYPDRAAPCRYYAAAGRHDCSGTCAKRQR